MRNLPLKSVFAATALMLGAPAAHGQDAQSDPDSLDSAHPAAVFRAIAQTEQIRATIAQIDADSAIAGDPVEGWSAQGVDLREAMAAMEQARGSSFIFESNGAGVFIAHRGEPVLMPEGIAYRHRMIDGEAPGEVETGLMQVLPGIWFEMVTGTQRIGTAACGTGFRRFDLLSAKPLSQWTRDELGTTALVFGLIEAGRDDPSCVLYRAVEDGKFNRASYTRDGRPLLNLTAPERRTQLVGREELAALAPMLR